MAASLSFPQNENTSIYWILAVNGNLTLKIPWMTKLNANVSLCHLSLCTKQNWMLMYLFVTPLAVPLIYICSGFYAPYACPQEQFQTFQLSRAGVCKKRSDGPSQSGCVDLSRVKFEAGTRHLWVRSTQTSSLAAHAFATDCESTGCPCQQRLAQQTLLRTEEAHATWF